MLSHLWDGVNDNWERRRNTGHAKCTRVAARVRKEVIPYG